MTNGNPKTAPPAPLLVCVTIDTDEDCYDKSQFSEMGATWRGMDEGVPALLDAIADLRDSRGGPIAFTWYLRCDECIKALTGTPRWILDTYAKLWAKRESMGDELGWHVHLFEDVADIVDEHGEPCAERIRSRMDLALEALGDDRARMRSSRIGHAFFGSTIGAFLDGIGVRVDSTAMPGRTRHDDHIMLDWGPTPRSPYRPSTEDYRVPGTPSLRLIEVPFTMIATRTAYDTVPLMRYVDLAFRPEVVREGLEQAAREYPLIVSIVHPSEVLAAGEHSLVAFNTDAVHSNLKTILDECDRIGRPVEFTTIEAATRSLGMLHD